MIHTNWQKCQITSQSHKELLLLSEKFLLFFNDANVTQQLLKYKCIIDEDEF